jgi:sugar/nucleoside kinase (ribokinase family)
MASVVCLGELLIDFVAVRPGVYQRAAGGAPANVAVGLARLGARSAFLSMVGDDAFGRFLRETLARDGVDIRGLISTREAPTGLAFISLDRRGERRFTFYRRPCADALLAPGDLRAAPWRGARIFHYGSISLIAEPSRSATLAAIARARRAGMRLSCDPNLRLALWPSPARARAGMREALRHADIVKVSEEEVAFLGHTPRAPLVVITRGPRGGTVLDGARRFDYPAFPVRAVDTTGAGDAFVAGLLYGLLREMPVEEAVRWAAACGALATTKRGAIPALPSLEAVERLIRVHRR